MHSPGDKQILKQEEDIELEKIEEHKAVLYTLQNSKDDKENIDINVQLGAAGVFVYNITIKEKLLLNIYNSLPSEISDTISYEKLRYLIRSLLLDLELVGNSENSEYNEIQDGNYYDPILLHNCVLESELIVKPNYESYYNLHVNEKFEADGDSNGSEKVNTPRFFNLNFNKRICTFRITDNDTLRDSQDKEFQLDLQTQDYLYLAEKISDKRKYDCYKWKLKYNEQREKSELLSKQLDEVVQRYEDKIIKIEYAAVQLVNEKKRKIRKLVDLLEANEKGIDSDASELDFINGEDLLHSQAEMFESDEEEEEETENGKESTNSASSEPKPQAPEIRSTNLISPRKRRTQGKDTIIKRRKESQYSDFNSTPTLINTQLQRQPANPQLSLLTPNTQWSMRVKREGDDYDAILKKEDSGTPSPATNRIEKSPEQIVLGINVSDNEEEEEEETAASKHSHYGIKKLSFESMNEEAEKNTQTMGSKVPFKAKYQAKPGMEHSFEDDYKYAYRGGKKKSRLANNAATTAGSGAASTNSGGSLHDTSTISNSGSFEGHRDTDQAQYSNKGYKNDNAKSESDRKIFNDGTDIDDDDATDVSDEDTDM